LDNNQTFGNNNRKTYKEANKFPERKRFEKLDQFVDKMLIHFYYYSYSFNKHTSSHQSKVMVQTIFAPKMLIALAYDSGGVTTSTVTVPLVAALGLGLSNAVPGRNPAIDGFGLIAFASLFPIITVLGYAQFMSLKIKILKTKSEKNAV